MPITGDAKGYKASLEEVAGECVDTHYRTLKEYYCRSNLLVLITTLQFTSTPGRRSPPNCLVSSWTSGIDIDIPRKCNQLHSIERAQMGRVLPICVSSIRHVNLHSERGAAPC